MSGFSTCNGDQLPRVVVEQRVVRTTGGTREGRPSCLLWWGND